MTLKVVLFDLDNTLVDFMSMKRDAVRAAAEAMVEKGLNADVDKLEKKLFDFYLEYGIESNDAFLKFLEKNFGTVNHRVLAAAVVAYISARDAKGYTYPGVRETIQKLKKKNYKIGLVSDGPRLKVWIRLVKNNLDDLFDTVVTFDDTSKRKPAKEPFLKACKNLKVKPQECLMVGDWPERDIAGAKAVGMKTCWAKYGANRESNIGDYYISNLNEILKLNLIKGDV
jgi:HAD superfamily hydrolase (TIGR02253 family)